MSWLPKQKVVVPIDFGETSFDAIKTALDLVDGAENVVVAHILIPLDGLSPGVVWGKINDESREAAVRKTFDKHRQEQGLPEVRFEVRFGDPGLEITDLARDEKADLIVIPSHGYDGVKRLVLGSVAERVLRHSNCPVLVLRRSDAE